MPLVVMTDGPSDNLVSVIIPCYNHAQFLGEAIDSVLRQTYSPVELIVVDDGSTDHFAQIIAAYPTIRHLRQDNLGVARARNMGLSHSLGAYLIFLDADDRLLPGAIDTGVRALAARTECALAFGPSVSIGTSNGVSNLPRDAHYNYHELLKRNFIGNPGSVLYNRWVFSHVGGFDEANSAAADYDLYLRVTLRYPIVCHHSAVVEYRRHADNMSNDARVMLKATLTALKKQKRHVEHDSARKAAYHAGRRFYKSSYGEPLIDCMYRSIARGDLLSAVSEGYALVRFFPSRVLLFGCRTISKFYSRFRNTFSPQQ